MARREILEYPDSRLRLPAEPVDTFDDELSRLAGDLFDTMYAAKAIGLSAPQVDVRSQVLVMDLSVDGTAPQVYVNPEILSSTRPGLVEESCASLPGVVGTVVRATELRVRAHDLDGAAFERDLSAMEAVCLQHEMDHLEGTLFVDRLSIFRRLRIRAAAAAAARRRRRAA